MIRPLRAMGVEELKRVNPNIIDAGIEFPLPRCAYRHFSEKGGLLFFNPGKVKVKNAEQEIKEVVLNNLQAIGDLFKEPITVLKTGFTENSCEVTLKDNSIVEEPHWVWIDTQGVGFGKTYAEQLLMAKEEDKKAYPQRYEPTAQVSKHTTERPKQIVNMAGINDLALGMLMAFAILKESHFVWDPSARHGLFIRVKRKNDYDSGKQITMSYTPSGLYIKNHIFHAAHNMGFVFERKFFKPFAS